MNTEKYNDELKSDKGSSRHYTTS